MSHNQLKEELTNDPLARGYSGMTDEQARDSLNTVNRTKSNDLITGDELFAVTDLVEWAALTDHRQSLWMQLCSRDSVNPLLPATIAFVTYVFGSSSTLRSLTALQTKEASRAGELGISEISVPHVSFARRGSYEEQ
jgi:hypothetical protein